MNNIFVECLVAQKTPASKLFLKYLLTMLTVVFLVFALAFNVAMWIPAILCGVAAYFISMEASLEFEYLYVDKEISVDKILGKSKRKNVAKFDLDKMEIFAPIRSAALDPYKNRKMTIKDYSIGYEAQPDERYVMIVEGQTKVILSPSPAFVEAMKTVAPRKVSTY